MQNSITLNLGRTATGMIDIVTLEGDHIAGAIEIDTPVVVAVAGSRVVGFAVDEGVGDGDAVVGFGAQDDVLAADEGELAVYSSVGVFVDGEGGTDLVMIDPYVIRCLSLVTGISKRSENINDRIYPLFQTGRCLSFCSFTTRSSFGKTQGCARE